MTRPFLSPEYTIYIDISYVNKYTVHIPRFFKFILFFSPRAAPL